MSSRATPQQFQQMTERLKRTVGVSGVARKLASGAAMQTLRLNDSKDVAKLNKTEAAFLIKLRADKWPWVGVQCLTLKLGDDCRYTPDFITVDEGVIVAWEVKGFWRDDARVKIKTAARMYPWIQFIAITRKTRKSGWIEEDIAP